MMLKKLSKLMHLIWRFGRFFLLDMDVIPIIQRKRRLISTFRVLYDRSVMRDWGLPRCDAVGIEIVLQHLPLLEGEEGAGGTAQKSENRVYRWICDTSTGIAYPAAYRRPYLLFVPRSDQHDSVLCLYQPIFVQFICSNYSINILRKIMVNFVRMGSLNAVPIDWVKHLIIDKYCFLIFALGLIFRYAFHIFHIFFLLRQ